MSGADCPKKPANATQILHNFAVEFVHVGMSYYHGLIKKPEYVPKA